MASLVARALMEEGCFGDAHTEHPGVDRILLATFWRPSTRSTPAAVVPISGPTSPASGHRTTARTR